MFEGYRGAFLGGCTLCGISLVWKDEEKSRVTENINYVNIVILHPWGVAEDFCFYEVELETSAPDKLF